MAPGHNSIVADVSSGDWIVYHAVNWRRLRSKPGDEVNTRRVMLIDRIVWQDAGPRVEGGIPSMAPRPAPR